jgi:CheY-like chemotaxis protein
MPTVQNILAEYPPRRKLLIVDDELATRTLLTHILSGLGYSVRSAEDGFAALKSIREDAPDIVVSDLNMPGMSGFEFLSVVRRRFPSIRVIAMSGAYTGNNVPQAIAADAFYEKATNAGALFQMVAAVSNDQRDSIVPVWVPSNGHNPSGQPYVNLAGPDCLRTFAQTLDPTASLIQETQCIHCSMPIHFAVVKPSGIPGDHAAPKKSNGVAAPQMHVLSL